MDKQRCGEHEHRVIVIEHTLLHSVDEEVVLVHVYLDAGCSSVEVLKSLRTVLQSRGVSENRTEGERTSTRTCIIFGSPLR